MWEQSPTERAQRLARGCCPIHDAWMGQVDGWHYPKEEVEFSPRARGAYDTLSAAGDALNLAAWQRASGLTHGALTEAVQELRGLGVVTEEGHGVYRAKSLREYTIVACSHQGCGVRAKAYAVDGPWELLPEFAHLLA